MSEQSNQWSRAADRYEEDFIDPYRPDVNNPVIPVLHELAEAGARTVADLGCGTGPLLPFLADQFDTVYAVDFAEGMLKRARQRCDGLKNIHFLYQPLTDLLQLAEQMDVVLAMNSLVMPDIAVLEKCLREIYRSLRPGGAFLAMMPAMDAVHYHTMLLVDRALAAGKPIEAARKNAAHFGEHHLYDFAFGQFYYKGIEQHFWQPFEIEHRLARVGFRSIRLQKVTLTWDLFAFDDRLKKESPPWDWFVRAER